MKTKVKLLFIGFLLPFCMYSMDSLDTFMATASYAVENMWNLQKQKSELKIFSQIFMLYPMFEWDSAH